MDVISTVRSRVCPSVTPMIASIDGSRPPGKMYFWIQVYVLREASIRLLRHRDGLDRDPAARRYQPVEGLEVGGPEAVSHGLDHLDRHHGVVAAVDVAVVQQIDLHAVGQARGGDAPSRQAAAVRPTASPSARARRARRRECTIRPSRFRFPVPDCRGRPARSRAGGRSCAAGRRPDWDRVAGSVSNSALE